MQEIPVFQLVFEKLKQRINSAHALEEVVSHVFTVYTFRNADLDDPVNVTLWKKDDTATVKLGSRKIMAFDKKESMELRALFAAKRKQLREQALKKFLGN